MKAYYDKTNNRIQGICDEIKPEKGLIYLFNSADIQQSVRSIIKRIDAIAKRYPGLQVQESVTRVLHFYSGI